MFDAWLQWSIKNYNWRGHCFGPQTIVPLLIMIVGSSLVHYLSNR